MTPHGRLLAGLAKDGRLPWSEQVRAAGLTGLSLAAVEEEALQNGLLPARYARNQATFSTEDQLRFLQARIAVVGCGGIGGHVVEGLARLGIGTIVAIDPDSFDESNLNRQAFATVATLGRPKVEAAAARLAEVNPVVRLVAHRRRLDRDNGAELLEGCDAAVDALDSIAARRDLAAACDVLAIPMVHGAIAGWYGQLTLRRPGASTLDQLYGQGGGSGEQVRLGNPSFTPMAAAAFEIAEVCKLLARQGRTLEARALLLDLGEGMLDEIAIPEGASP